MTIDNLYSNNFASHEENQNFFDILINFKIK